MPGLADEEVTTTIRITSVENAFNSIKDESTKPNDPDVIKDDDFISITIKKMYLYLAGVGFFILIVYLVTGKKQPKKSNKNSYKKRY